MIFFFMCVLEEDFNENKNYVFWLPRVRVKARVRTAV